MWMKIPIKADTGISVAISIPAAGIVGTPAGKILKPKVVATAKLAPMVAGHPMEQVPVTTAEEGTTVVDTAAGNLRLAPIPPPPPLTPPLGGMASVPSHTRRHSLPLFKSHFILMDMFIIFLK